MITFGCLDERGEIMDGRKNGWMDGRGVEELSQ